MIFLISDNDLSDRLEVLSNTDFIQSFAGIYINPVI